jgi:diacylglycerol kinase
MTSASASWRAKFANAAAGILWSLRTQSSFWVHVPVAVVVLGLAAWLRLPAWRWCVLVMVIGFVFSLELLNTAIEQFVKVVHPEQDPRIGHGLDAAAGAVLIMAIVAVTVGLITLGVPLYQRILTL